MSNVKDIIELVRTRKWDTLLILLLLVIVMITVPVWVTLRQKEIATEVAQEVNEPIYALLSKMDSRQMTLENQVGQLYDIQKQQILKSAIAGYKKVNGDLSKLESSTQNSAAIELGLSIPEVKELLLTFDREQTLVYLDYFGIGG